MIAVYSQQEFDDAYDIGKREGYEQAVQEIDMQTGGDGVYRACLGGADPERHTPDAITMITRIVNRFEILMLLDEATKDGSDQPDDGLEPSPEPIADDSLKAQIGEIGNQIHNLGCEHQSNEELAERLGELASSLWSLAASVASPSPSPRGQGE